MEVQEESNDYSICMACLCVGRTLKKINDKRLKEYYMDTLNEIPLCIMSHIQPVVCWECEAMMRKVIAFKEQVKDSYRVLHTYTKENLNECLLSEVGRPSHLKIHKNENVNVLPDGTEKLQNVKAERDTVAISLHRGSPPKDVFKTEVPEIVSVLCDSKKQHVRKSLLSGVRRQSRVKSVRSKIGNACDDVDRLEVKVEKNEDTRQRTNSNSGVEMKEVADIVSVLCDVKKQKSRKRESQLKPEWNLDTLAIDYDVDGEAAELGDCGGANDNDDTFLEICIKSDSGGRAEDEKPTLKNKAESLITKMNKVRMKTNHKAIKSDIASLARAVELSYGDVRAERERRARASRYVRAPHRCRTCLLAFPTAAAARSHQREHHAPELGEYICPICYIIVATVESFTTHYNRHIKRYECNVCQKRTEDVKTMRRHLHARHPAAVRRARSSDTPQKQTMEGRGGGRVPCADCDKTFSHRAGLMNHRLAMHEAQNQYPCGVCDKVFRWKTSLKRHLEKHQAKEAGGAASGAGAAYCVECDVRFSSACSLQRHLRNSLKHVTHDQLKFICEHCNKRFADKTKLRNHIEEKHLHWTYTCQICNKPSKNRVGLEQHIRNVHKGRPHNKVCHHCGKAFPTKVQLESHIRSHTGERPFICEYCPTTFSQQSNLYKHHRQVHQNIKSKRYPLCKKRRTEVPIVDPQQPEGLPVPPLLYYENILGV